MFDGARELAKRFFGGLLLLLHRMQSQRVVDGSNEGGSIQLRTGQVIPHAALNDLGHVFFVRVLGQQNERKGNAGVQKVAQHPNRIRITGLVFEQHQPVRILLEHCPGFLHGMGMIEFDGQHFAIALQNLANQKEVFFLCAHQQYAQYGRGQFGFGRSHHKSTVTCSYRNRGGLSAQSGETSDMSR